MANNPELLSEFDSLVYRQLHPDLATMRLAEAERHYANFGSKEGRIATWADTREGFLREIVNKQQGDVLEIGPFCAPTLKGPSIFYLDVLNSAELRARALEHGLNPDDCPTEIHYTCPLSEVERRFDAIFCSHAIEHQTDLVDHFRSVARMMTPGGRYYLIIPDKRFCFDALLGTSSVADVLQAHREQRRRHTFANVIEHLALTTHNDPLRHWAGDHGEIDQDAANRRIASAIKEYDAANGAYIDTHAWRFTPGSFRQIVKALVGLGLIELDAVRVYNTPRDRLEFCAVLEAA